MLKYSVICGELGPLGVLYLDLLARPGKVPSSGILYPVRCGRELTGERLMMVCLGQQQSDICSHGAVHGLLYGIVLLLHQLTTIAVCARGQWILMLACPYPDCMAKQHLLW